MAVDNVDSPQRSIHNKFRIYVTDREATAITSDALIRILDTLGVDNLTATDISRAVDIPLSTVNKHIDTLLEYGLIAPHDNGTRDQRKRFFKSTCHPYLDNLATIPERERYKEKACLTSTVMMGDVKTAIAYSHALTFNFGMYVGLNYEHVMRHKAIKVFEAVESLLDIDMKFEEYIDTIKKILASTDVGFELEIDSYNPLTLLVKYNRLFPEYPNELLKFAVEEFAMRMLKKYFEGPVKLSRDELLVCDENRSVQELTFII